MIVTDLFESHQTCTECGGPAFSDLLLAEKKDACYSKVRSRYKVWPSAYASGALVQCRKKGADNWGNKSKNEDVAEDNDHSLKKVWDRYSKHLMAARGDHPDIRQINKSGEIVRNIRKYVKDHHGQKAVDDMERYAEKQQWNEGVAEGVRDLGYDAQSLIMKLRRDVEEKRLQPTRQAVLAAASELAGDMDFAPELLVRQVLGQGVAEGNRGQLRVAAPKSEILSASDTGKIITIRVRAPDGTPKTFSNPNPSIVQKWLDKYGLRLPHQIASKFVYEDQQSTKSMITESRTYKLWESAGHKLMEAQLTADQINQIFQQVEQGATAAGDNRTLIGQGKDAASAVNTAWEELKTKVQNSGPIKGVDAMYDQAAEQLKQATGGEQGVMQYVEKYRAFAKKHPVAQSLIYSALIAAAGISGAGLGGAAALGLFKLVDKLLQGEKFSSAAYSGAKTGALAYGAGQIGQAIKGTPQSVAPDASAATNVVATGGRAARDAVLKGAMQSAEEAVKSGAVTDYNSMTDTISNIMSKYDGAAGISPQSLQTIEQMVRLKLQAGMVGGNGILQGGKAVAGAAANAMQESINLSESQIFLLIGKIVERQRKLDEGIMDTIKGAAGKAVDWAKTKGTNLTTKVTADKLLQAWKKAGSPTDSLDVAKVIQSAGVPSASIKQVYGTMQIPFAGEPGGGATPAPAVNPAAQTPAAQTSAAPSPSTAPKQAPVAQQPAAPAQPAQAGTTGSAQGFNASNVMKMPGMEKYAKPATAPAAKTANFGGGPTGYSKTTTTIKPSSTASAKQPTVAAESSEESLADQFMKMAQAKGYNVRQAGTPEQERERSQQRLAQREKDQAEKQQQHAQADFEQLPELKAEYQKMQDLYKSLGGSNWQYADREQNLTDRERQARDMENQLSILSGRIKRAEQLKEQSGMEFGEAKHEEKIAGRYDPDDFDLMVKRLGQKAREQEKSRPVDVQDLARRLRAIEQSQDSK